MTLKRMDVYAFMSAIDIFRRSMLRVGLKQYSRLGEYEFSGDGKYASVEVIFPARYLSWDVEGDISFRLAAADISKSSKSNFPRLHFPVSRAATECDLKFPSMIQEASSARWELCFEVDPSAVDVVAWHTISPFCRGFVVCVLEVLPDIVLKLAPTPFPLWESVAASLHAGGEGVLKQLDGVIEHV